MSSLDIRARAQDCIDQFQTLLLIKEDVNSAEEAGANLYDVGWVEEQLARFKMWAGNIGTFAEGHASLDYRLRDSEETRRFMLDFLFSLRSFVQSAIETLKPESANSRLVSRNDSPVAGDGMNGSDVFETSITSTISSSFQGTETDSVLDQIGTGNITEFSVREKRMQGIEKAIDRLYRLSLIIRQPSRSSQNARAEKFALTDEAGNEIDEAFALYARRIVEHRFPDAPEFLRKKLSYGILIRRKRFLYRQSHQRKLSGATSSHDKSFDTRMDMTKKNERASTIRTFIPADGIPLELTSSPEPHLLPATSATTASAIPAQPFPLATALEDVQSTQSTTFTATPTMSAPVEIPRPPKPTAGSKEFECPYCCLMLPIKHSKALRWRRHVLEDLEPYTCVLEECAENPTIFQDRAAWSHHLQAHSTRWVCTTKAHEARSFPTEETYLEHMHLEHVGSFTDSQLPWLARRSRVPTPVTFQQCPLCSYVPSEGEVQQHLGANKTHEEKLITDRIMKHLASHLEGLAVKSLPWQELPEDESEDESASGRAEEVSAQSEGGSRNLAMSDTTLHFPEEMSDADATLIDILVTKDEFTPPLDSSYEQDWGFIPRPVYFGHDRDEILQPLLQRLFLNDSGPSTISETLIPAYLVPVAQEKKFFGRDFALNAISQTLCESGTEGLNDNKPISFPRCYAVYGPGGMGKTQVAAHFVHKHRSEFDVVLWVHADDAGKITQDYKDIAISLGLVDPDSRDAMDLEYTKDVVKRWLVSPRKGTFQSGEKITQQASWLMVFDGVEDGKVLNEFWPYNAPGSILITSRNPYSWSASLELKPFSIYEATEYLFRLTERESSHDEQTAATAIATRLGGLPLALSQMAGIIAYQHFTFAQFLNSFEQHDGSEKFLNWRASDNERSLSNYEYNVASVWAFDRLEEGAHLMNVICMLDPDAIPEALFTSPITERSSELVRDLKTGYISTRTELLARSLVTGNKREKKIFVHRLVQDVARARMRQSDIRIYFIACVELINEIWPFQQLTWRHGVARWADCEELFPHVQRLKSMFPSITPSPDSFEDYEFARLLIDSAWYQHERGKSFESIYSNNMAQSICESLKLRLLEYPALAETSPVTLIQLNDSLLEIAHNRGCIALEINEPIDALKYHTLFNETMVRERALHHPTDMRLAISWNELGNAYMLNGNWKRGEECFLISIEEMRKYINYKPTTISLPLANLGLAYWLQSKNGLAHKVLQEGLHAREAEFGVDDRESFITGRFLHALGNVTSSLDYHRRALMHYKSTLGNRHHRTADVFVKVAEHNIKLGNYDMALALLDHSLDAFAISRTYMPEKTRAAWMRYQALKGLGRIKEAENELMNCHQIYWKLRAKRPESRLKVKTKPEELDDSDIDDLIVFWSK